MIRYKTAVNGSSGRTAAWHMLFAPLRVSLNSHAPATPALPLGFVERPQGTPRGADSKAARPSLLIPPLSSQGNGSGQFGVSSSAPFPVLKHFREFSFQKWVSYFTCWFVKTSLFYLSTILVALLRKDSWGYIAAIYTCEES